MSRQSKTALLTPRQRQLLLAEYDLLPRNEDGRVLRGMRQLLARKWGVHRNYPATLASQRARDLREVSTC